MKVKSTSFEWGILGHDVNRGSALTSEQKATATQNRDTKIRVEKMEDAIEIFDLPKRPVNLAGRGRYFNGVVYQAAYLSQEAYELLKRDGYAASDLSESAKQSTRWFDSNKSTWRFLEGDTFVFDLGRMPEKYTTSTAPKSDPEFKYDTADNMLDSIFDYIYGDIADSLDYKDMRDHGYSRIELILVEPKKVEAPPAAPVKPAPEPKPGRDISALFSDEDLAYIRESFSTIFASGDGDTYTSLYKW